MPRIGVPVFAMAAVAVLGVAGFWFLQRQGGLRSAPPPPLSPEAKAYVRNLQLSEVHMKATESYLKQTIIEIEGKITNSGDRPVRDVDLYCIFYDAYSQVVLREKTPIVRGGLKPAETRNFRLPFDGLPGSWNQGYPQLVIANIVFD